jgi:hypothetical protein
MLEGVRGAQITNSRREVVISQVEKHQAGKIAHIHVRQRVIEVVVRKVKDGEAIEHLEKQWERSI